MKKQKSRFYNPNGVSASKKSSENNSGSQKKSKKSEVEFEPESYVSS
jgi:hypothetical protein